MSDLPKSEWGEGPWQHEPDKMEWRDEETGLPCLIVRGPAGALCGYVGVAPSHPFHGLSYDGLPKAVHDAQMEDFRARMLARKTFSEIGEIAAGLERQEPDAVGQMVGEIEVHGGLTYSDKCTGKICHVPEPGESDDVWWFGFDCAHAGDYLPAFERRDDPVLGLGCKTGWGGVIEYRDIPYVQAECATLAKQLAAI